MQHHAGETEAGTSRPGLWQPGNNSTRHHLAYLTLPYLTTTEFDASGFHAWLAAFRLSARLRK
jgi:hypothetical protein